MTPSGARCWNVNVTMFGARGAEARGEPPEAA